MFDLPQSAKDKVKGQSLRAFLGVTATNTAVSGMMSPDSAMPKIGAFHYAAILHWFLIHEVTDPAEMFRQLEAAVKDQ